LKPVWANSSPDSLKKKSSPSQKKAGGVAQGVGPEFKPQYHRKGRWWTYSGGVNLFKVHCMHV
jgi:hypothetical protein